MSSLLEPIARFFVAPAEPSAGFAPPRPRPVVAGVVAPEPLLPVAAGALAAALRRDARSGAALVCVWRGHPDPPLHAPAPGAPAAARLAAKLARRGLAARACGTLCVVELPLAEAAAAIAFRDAAAAADAPAVLALARRHPALDMLLRAADRLVVALPADADPLLADLAADSLARLGPPVERTDVPRGALGRQAARLGLSAPAAVPPELPAGALKERLS